MSTEVRALTTARQSLRNRRKRHLVSLRIPELVALRVHARMSE